jgi:hypothetical protein
MSVVDFEKIAIFSSPNCEAVIDRSNSKSFKLEENQKYVVLNDGLDSYTYVAVTKDGKQKHGLLKSESKLVLLYHNNCFAVQIDDEESEEITIMHVNKR